MFWPEVDIEATPVQGKEDEKFEVKTRDLNKAGVLKEGDVRVGKLVDNVYSQDPTCPIYEAVP